MTTDIVERLCGPVKHPQQNTLDKYEAADEITRLREELHQIALEHQVALDRINRLREENKLLLEKRESCINIEGAPHGFVRNASHTADRYVCECEGWAEQEIHTLRQQYQDCVESNKAVEEALMDVPYSGTYADGVRYLLQQVKELETYYCNDARDLKIDLAASQQERNNWKSAYLEQVELHNKTLDELRIEEQRFSDQWEILAESQAREAKLWDELSGITGWLEQGVCLSDDEWTAYEHEVNWNRAIQAKYQSAINVLALPQDDTALREAIQQAKREALLEAADYLEGQLQPYKGKTWYVEELRRMAEELK